MKRSVRVLIVDDQPEVRKALRRVLDREARFEIADAGGGADALAIVATAPPDLVLLDISMPTMNGLAVIPQILEASPDSKIVVLSSHFAMESEVLAAGAHSFLPKDTKPKDLVKAIDRALGL